MRLSWAVRMPSLDRYLLRAKVGEAEFLEKLQGRDLADGCFGESWCGHYY